VSVTRIDDPRQTSGGLVRLLVDRLEVLRDRRAQLDDQIDAHAELLTVASGPASDRNGDLSARELLIDLAGDEHLLGLLRATNLMPKES
jgi:hypothetical protein